MTNSPSTFNPTPEIRESLDLNIFHHKGIPWKGIVVLLSVTIYPILFLSPKVTLGVCPR